MKLKKKLIYKSAASLKSAILPAATMAIGVLMMSSCNTSGCTDNQSSLPLAGFYSSSTGTSVSVSDIDISGIGAPGDSVLYPSGTARSTVFLPFRSSKESTSYCFHYTSEGINNPELNDTLTFRYTSKPFFASEECGAVLNYTITEYSYTTHIIDSVVVADSLITNTNIERIKIYFRTKAAETDR